MGQPTRAAQIVRQGGVLLAMLVGFVMSIAGWEAGIIAGGLFLTLALIAAWIIDLIFSK